MSIDVFIKNIFIEKSSTVDNANDVKVVVTYCIDKEESSEDKFDSVLVLYHHL